jgi:hypothetical protein
MPYDGDDRDWGDDNGDDWEEPRETITHRHPSLPFIEITQTRCAGERTTEDDGCETWGFEILGPREAEEYPLAYDGVAYTRGDHTEAEMIADMAYRAEKHMLDDRGTFFVLRIYLETGEYRHEIDAVMRKHGQSPLWRRAESRSNSLTHRRSSIEKMRFLARPWIGSSWIDMVATSTRRQTTACAAFDISMMALNSAMASNLIIAPSKSEAQRDRQGQT